MTKKEAWIQFEQEHKKWIEEKKEEFLQKMQESVFEISTTFQQLLKQSREELEKKEKEAIMYCYISLLRNGLFENEYSLLLQWFDQQWYLDKEPVLIEGNLNFLFEDVSQVKEKLLLDSKQYLGKINCYDIEYLFQDIVMECNSYLAEQLRFLFRDIEENEDFKAIKKQEAWTIRYGEYRDQSEIIAHVDRTKKEQTEFKQKIKSIQSGKEEQALACTYWYDMELTDVICQNIFMPFITFEQCTLRNVDFTNSMLKGARFLNCTLEHCVFKQGDLRQAEFRNCIWNETVFDGADVGYAIFVEQELPFAHLEAGQLQTILVEREEG